MTYLALGDSISIDEYTGVKGGGAASQLAQLLDAERFMNFTRDGHTSGPLLQEMQTAAAMPGTLPAIDLVTVTIGGNDVLSGYYMREIGERGAERVAVDRLIGNLDKIGALLAQLSCPVILSGIYDPTDGDDSKAGEMGLPVEARGTLRRVNAHIQAVALRHGFLYADLERLFLGHGFWSAEPWLVMHIEPNLAGAKQIARHWHDLYQSR